MAMMYYRKKSLSNRKNMVRDTYFLPPRKALVCRIAGAAFLMLAALTATIAATWLIGPAPFIYVDNKGVRWKSEPLTLLDEQDRTIVAASVENSRRFAAYVARPRTRMMLAAIRQVKAIPFVCLILGIGLALRRLGGRHSDPLARALPWLRRASIAAILWALSMPVVDSLTATVLAHGLPNDEDAFYFAVTDWTEVNSALMLAIAAYATIWAIETGLRAQRDLDDFV